MFLIVASLLCVALAALLAQPFLRERTGDAPKRDFRGFLSATYQRLEDDAAAGVIDDEAAVDAKRAAQRAVLAVKDETEAAPLSRGRRFAAVAVIALSPVFVAAVYLSVGAPEALTPAAPPPLVSAGNDPAANPARERAEAIAALPEDDRRAAIDAMVASLASRLEASPEDVAGWRMLARSYGALGRAEESADAWREVFKRSRGTVDDRRAFAATLIALGEDDQSEALALIAETLDLHPEDPMTLFQLGGALRASGAPGEAAEAWRRLLAALPVDAPIRDTVTSLIAEAESDMADPGDDAVDQP
ncbi:MAG: c-type cytochrome biogenesis protein CcmI [Pseudomonadota bacterium]